MTLCRRDPIPLVKLKMRHVQVSAKKAAQDIDATLSAVLLELVQGEGGREELPLAAAAREVAAVCASRVPRAAARGCCPK